MYNPSQYHQFNNYQNYQNLPQNVSQPVPSFTYPHQEFPSHQQLPLHPYSLGLPQNYVVYKPDENLSHPSLTQYGYNKINSGPPPSNYYHYETYPVTNSESKNNYYDGINFKRNSNCDYDTQYNNIKECKSEIHYELPKHYQSPENLNKEVNNRLPSPESFIKECQSGKKSSERLTKEEIIKNSFKIKRLHSANKPRHREARKCRDSSQSNDNYSFVEIKKVGLKNNPWQRFRKDLHCKHQKNKEFLRRWR